MHIQTKKGLFSLTHLTILVCLFLTQSVNALDETFQIYTPPEILLMGGGGTAMNSGFGAMFNNPAGIAKPRKSQWEATLFSLDGRGGAAALAHYASIQSFGIYQTNNYLQGQSGQYIASQWSFTPTFLYRGFGITFLGTNHYAGKSDGTNIDVRAGQDVGVVLGFASNFAGNLIKLGMTVKGIQRNILQGTYDHGTVNSESTVNSQMKEGIGVGADFGVMFTLPGYYLPSIGLSWRDATNTRFSEYKYLNPLSSGAPDAIPQTFNAGFSIQPVLIRGLRSIFTIDYRDISRSDITLVKHLHFGLQFETEKQFYFWFGANHLLPTLGLGWKVRGGSLECGLYGEDIGPATSTLMDARMNCRYGVGF